MRGSEVPRWTSWCQSSWYPLSSGCLGACLFWGLRFEAGLSGLDSLRSELISVVAWPLTVGFNLTSESCGTVSTISCLLWPFSCQPVLLSFVLFECQGKLKRVSPSGAARHKDSGRLRGDSSPSFLGLQPGCHDSSLASLPQPSPVHTSSHLLQSSAEPLFPKLSLKRRCFFR